VQLNTHSGRFVVAVVVVTTNTVLSAQIDLKCMHHMKDVQ
jgi:hypothetical protein